MNRRLITGVCFLFLAVILLAGLAQSARADGEKITDCICYNLEQEYIPLLYVPSTCPDNVKTQGWYIILALEQRDNGQIPREYTESCEVTLLSGDQFIADALSFGTENDEDNGTYSWLGLDDSKLTQPGKAELRIHQESEHFALDKDVTIRVVSWEEYPALAERDGEHVINTVVGEKVTCQSLIDNLVIEDSLSDEAAALMETGDTTFTPSVFPKDENAWEMMEEDIESFFYIDAYGFFARKAGTCSMTVKLWYGNFVYEGSVTINALDYELTGPAILFTGQSAVYQVRDMDEASGRTFTLSAEGEGISFDPVTGTLTVSDSVPDGTQVTVTATPEEGIPFSVKATVLTGYLHSLQFDSYEQQGFRIPVPDGSAFGPFPGLEGKKQVYVCWLQDALFSSGASFEVPEIPLVITAADAEAVYNDDGIINGNCKNIETEDVMIDGHPARIWVFEQQSGSDPLVYRGILYYARNNRLLALYYNKYTDGSQPQDTSLRITLEDMRMIADQIGYDESKATLTEADVQVTITEKNGATAVTAGKNLEFSAAFASPEKIDNPEYMRIDWSVLKASGDTCEDISSITEQGQLSVSKTLAEPVELVVQALAGSYGTRAEYKVTAIPAVKKVSVEPTELFLYMGTDTPQTVRVAMEPDNVPPVGLVWASNGKQVAEITDNGDGTATFRALQAGKGNVTVTEPGGKNAKLTVNVVDPVESVELTLKGSAKPGKTVTVAAALAPKSAGNKNVKWSVDVGEDVAVISEKGQLKISKDAASGTVITVTCTAMGAPEPIIATKQITVE